MEEQRGAGEGVGRCGGLRSRELGVSEALGLSLGL